jgi:hypothetical protein
MRNSTTSRSGVIAGGSGSGISIAGLGGHLARVLGSLDHRNIQLVTAAITRANG